MAYENFEKMVCKYFEKDSEKMRFLKEEAKEILESCKKNWVESDYKEGFEFEYERAAKNVLANSIWLHLMDLKYSARINSENPDFKQDTKHLFYDLLHELFEHIDMSDFAEELIEEIKQEVRNG